MFQFSRIKTNFKTDEALWVTAFIGALVAIWFLPVSYFLGTHPYWTMPSTDMMNSVIGMRYILAEPWHFPLLVAHNLLYPDGANIAFTDSIPLMALLTKALYPLWPTHGNYLGLWMLMNYVAQGASASYLLSGFRRYPIYVHICVASLALFIPAFLIRLVHTSLCSHFYILLSLGLAIRILNDRQRQRLAYWFTPLIVAALLTHVYLAAMSASIYGACQIQAYLENRPNRRLIVSQLLLTAAVTTAVYYICGYNGGYGGATYGFFSMNLYSPLVPQVSSLFAQPSIIDPSGGQYEGYNYVGAGLLLLFLTTMLFAWKNFVQLWRKYWSLGLLCIGLFFFALSTKIYAGSHVLFNACKLSFLCIHENNTTYIRFALFNQFRCSGRFFWPVTYIFLSFSIVALWPVLEKKNLTWLLYIIVLTQLADLDYLRDAQKGMLSHREDLNVLRQDIQPLVEAHSRVTILPSFSCSLPDELWKILDIVYLSSDKAIPVNSAFLARIKKIPDCGREIPDVAQRNLDPEELLVLLKSRISYDEALKIYSKAENCVQNDVYVFCSGKMPQLTALTKTLHPLSPYTAALDPSAPKDLLFKQDGNGRVYLGRGWFQPENWGVWNDGSPADILLPLISPVESDLSLHMVLGAFVTKDRPQDVELLVNGNHLTTFSFKQEIPAQTVDISIPVDMLKGKKLIVLTFIPKNPASPSELGAGPDKRRVGLSITELRLSK